MDYFIFNSASTTPDSGGKDVFVHISAIERSFLEGGEGIDPFDLIWDIDGGTTSEGGEGADPLDLIWDIDSGTTSRVAVLYDDTTVFDLTFNLYEETTAVTVDWVALTAGVVI